MKTHHVRAVTGHKSNASLESYNDRPTFEQFKNMSSAITDFINFCRPDHQVAINPLAEVNRSPLETVSKAIHSGTSTNGWTRRTFLFKKTCRLTLHMASFLVAPSPTARSISTLSKLWKRILDVFFSPDYWFRLSVRPFWAFWKHFVEKKLEQRFTTFELSVNNSCACTVHSSRMNWRVNKLPLNGFF